MNFTLYYRGLLKSNRGAKEKQELRRHFHVQLKELWTHLPLSTYRANFLDKAQQDQSLNILHAVGGFEFAPLVCGTTSMTADLNITLFRPQAPGELVGEGGDLDNRVKTLLDALKVPEANAVPAGDKPNADESPFYCVVEDDKLITGLTVVTERLLEPNLDRNEVLLLVKVTTHLVTTKIGTIGLG
jgi:hypothetical protein